MYPKLKEICKFVFQDRFSNYNGIYEVASIATFNEWYDSGIDIFATLYEPVGLTKVEYAADIDTLRNYSIYKLINLETKKLIYIPMEYTAEVPDPSVKTYQKIGIAVEIGIFKDPNKIIWIKNYIKEAIEAVSGTEKSPKLFQVKKVWLTDDEYTIIENERNISVQATTNHYTDKQALLRENARLRTIIAKYEETLKLLQAP
jgi:hypothetical protein